VRTGIFISASILIQLALSSHFSYASEHFADPPGGQNRHQTSELDLSCAELDAELAAREPLGYTDKPRFYTDPAHAASIWGGILWSPAWSYLAYSGLLDYQIAHRLSATRNRIAKLRQLKAQRHCYER
jgi:hypothetical protein